MRPRHSCRDSLSVFSYITQLGLEPTTEARKETLEVDKMRYVEANVFIYLLRAYPKDAFGVSRAIMRRIYDGEEAMTSTAILQEVVDWFEYNGKKG